MIKLENYIVMFLLCFVFLLPAAEVTDVTSRKEKASVPVLHFRDEGNKEYLDIGISLTPMADMKFLISIWVKNQGDKEKLIDLSKVIFSCIAGGTDSTPLPPDAFGPPMHFKLLNKTVNLKKGNTYERKTTISLPEGWKDKSLGFVLSYNKARIHFTFDGKNMQIEELPPLK